MNPLGSGFAGSDMRGLADQFRVPTRGLSQRDGEDGAIAMDDVAAENQRNAQPAFVERDALQCSALLGIAEIHDGAPAARANIVADLRVGSGIAGRRLRKLAEFLLQRHACQQRVDEALDVRG